MSDNIDTLINAYTTADADSRIAIIETLSDSTDERVSSLFLTTLSDKSEDDFVRVEVLKNVPFHNYTLDNYQRFCTAICTLLRDNEEDDIVRQFAALALRSFVEGQGVLELLERIVRTSLEEISVRHNALSSIERNVNIPSCQLSLKRLVDVPDLGRSAERTLKRISRSS